MIIKVFAAGRWAATGGQFHEVLVAKEPPAIRFVESLMLINQKSHFIIAFLSGYFKGSLRAIGLDL